MAKTDGTSSSSSNKDRESPLTRSQRVSPGSQSFSGTVEAGTSFIKPVALNEGRKEPWQNAKGFVSAVSSNAGSGSQNCNTEQHNDWLKHRTFAALKVEIDDSPLVSCVRRSGNVNVPPSVASVLSATDDHNRLSSSSGQCNTGERSRKVDEASVSSFEYRQVTPQQKDTSQSNLWRELRVVGSCDSSRGSGMTSSLQHKQSSTKASVSSLHITARSHPPSTPRPTCSSHYYPKMVPSSSQPTSDSDASGDCKHLAARLSKLSNRLKGGGVNLEASDSSAQTDVAGMKSLIERQRQSYIRRLKREIQWLEKVEKLLLEAQGRKRDSTFTKRAAEIALRPVRRAEEHHCHACHEVMEGAVADVLEQNASVHNSPLFVRCGFLRKFCNTDNDENFQLAHSTNGNHIAPRDLFKGPSEYHRPLQGSGTESATQPVSVTSHVSHHQQMTPAQSYPNERSVHYSDITNNQTVTLSYQHLTNGETTLENGTSVEKASNKSSIPVAAYPTSVKELTSTPYSCEMCRHRCPCFVKLSGIPMDSVHKIPSTDLTVRKSHSKSKNSPSILQASIYAPRFSSNRPDGHHSLERAFVSIPVTGTPRLTEDKVLSTKRLRASPLKMGTPVSRAHKNAESESPKEKPKVIRTQRLSKSGVAWYIPVRDTRSWLQHRGRADGSIADLEIPGQNDMEDGLARSVEELTLQDAFRCFKSAFILKSQARVKKVKIAARQRRHRIQSRAVALSRNRPFIATMPASFIDTLHRPCKRNFSHHEMRTQTERIYRTLPEFQQQIDYKRRKEANRTNRLMAEIYKTKILQKTLAGKVSYAITEKLL